MRWKKALVFFFILPAYKSFCQLTPIGQWMDHLPYGNSIAIRPGNGKLWCATPYSIYSVDLGDFSFERRSRLNGLSETGIRCIGSSPTGDQLVIAYSNSNVDVLDNNTVVNIPDIRVSTQSGDKTIFDIYVEGKLAYLSSGLGIIVLDLVRSEVKDTYVMGSGGLKIKVNSFSADNSYFYAATTEGLKRASRNNSNLADFRSWELLSGQSGLPSGPVDRVILFGNNLVAQLSDSLYMNSSGSWNFFYSDGWNMNNLDVSGPTLLIPENQGNAGRVIQLDSTGNISRIIQDLRYTSRPQQALPATDGFWIADSLAGLTKYSGNTFTGYVPNSPGGPATGDMIIRNSEVWVAAGSVDSSFNPKSNRDGLYYFSNNSWSNFSYQNIPEFDSIPDLLTVVIEPTDQSIWSGSFGGGLLKLELPGKVTLFKQNSPVQPAYFNSNSYRVSSLAFDGKGNLWISNSGAASPLLVKKTGGSWQSIGVPIPLAENAISQIIIDDLDQKWIIAEKGQGLLCYNHGNSIDNTGDDRWKWYQAGPGNGNLPDNRVQCLAKDKNGFIWIGTAQGIGIVQCPQDVFSSSGCEALIPVVQQDNFAGYLFRDESVQCMAVDGANRKWVGTRNGAWLISPDGEKTIYRFTSGNSPLPDNDVKRIAIDGVSGEVFFSTAKGICSFRSTATEADETKGTVLVFPNPVPPGYSGIIAIRGLPENSIVKITELSGRLVFQTRALGGQAVWNGKNYRGQSIASGVYLVLVKDESNQEKLVTKIVFVSQ